MKNTFKNLDIFNFNCINTIKASISSYNFKDDALHLCFQDTYFNDISEFSVFLKNIKTREIHECISLKEKDSLIIYLSNLKYLCTNYEYTIDIILYDSNSCKIIHPKYSVIHDKISKNSLVYKSNNIKWYLRILKNGDFRLSTIYLF